MINQTVNLSDLVNIAPLDLNITGLNSTNGAIDALRASMTNSVGDFWFMVSIVIIFVMLSFVFTRRENNMLLGTARGVVTSSIWCIFLTTGFLLGGLINTIIPLFWFSGTLLVTFATVFKLKTKGL